MEDMDRVGEAQLEYASGHKDLNVYKLAFDLAMRIFELSKTWPKGERYALTSQIRRSSRSVCGNLAEAWSKRRYKAHFVSKLTDCDGEVAETKTWLDFAQECKYIQSSEHDELEGQYRRVGAMLGKMILHPERWCKQ